MTTGHSHLRRTRSASTAAPTRGRRSAGLAPIFAAIVVGLAVISQDIVLMIGAAALSALLVWGAHRAPIFAFGAFYCVLYISAGAAFFGQVGHFPGGTASDAHVMRAVYLFFGGYAAMFAGYLALAGPQPASPLHLPAQFEVIKRDQLAIICFIIFTPEWLGIRVAGNADLSGFAQIARHLMDFRFVVLAYFILRSLDLDDMRSVIQIALITAYVGLPLSVTGGSGWAGMIIFCAMLVSYIFTAEGRSAVHYLTRNPVVTAAGALVLAGLLNMALLWEGGLKSEWRATINSGGAGADTVEQFGNLLSRAQTTADNVDYTYALEALGGRMSSGVGYFSLVLSNLEQGMPHTGGQLTMRAFDNVKPRLLFPDKPLLGSDSELVERYAGIEVAGAEQNTSIGLGFIPELQIDFGTEGMLIACLILGAIFAGSQRIMRWAAGDRVIGDLAFLVLIFFHALVYDASLAKFGAGIIHKTVVFTAILYGLRFAFPPRRAAAAGVAR